MINALEVLSSDLHDARSEFLRSVYHLEDHLTPAGADLLDDIKRSMAMLIDDVELSIINNGS